MLTAMPDPEAGAQAKKRVLPWRGPNPVRKTAAVVAMVLGMIVGSWAFIAGSTSERDANPRSTFLRLFGMAVLWVVAWVRMTQESNKKSARAMLIVWAFILLATGYQLATR
jgi:peptidoglycan/LPS O-acetylase OafA/YrhL